MEETSEELPNFSIGIDLLGPDPTSNKNKAEKNSQVARFANLSEDQLQQILPILLMLRVALGCASSYSYAFFVLSKLPKCIPNSIYAR